MATEEQTMGGARRKPRQKHGRTGALAVLADWGGGVPGTALAHVLPEPAAGGWTHRAWSHNDYRIDVHFERGVLLVGCSSTQHT